jgi:hypothetical protein
MLDLAALRTERAELHKKLAAIDAVIEAYEPTGPLTRLERDLDETDQNVAPIAPDPQDFTTEAEYQQALADWREEVNR